MEPVTGTLSVIAAAASAGKAVTRIHDAAEEVRAATKELNRFEAKVSELIIFCNTHNARLQELKPDLLSSVGETAEIAWKAIQAAFKVVERNRTDPDRVSSGSPKHTPPAESKWSAKDQAKYQRMRSEFVRNDEEVKEKLGELKRAVESDNRAVEIEARVGRLRAWVSLILAS